MSEGTLADDIPKTRDRETILLIHGSFAQPREGEVQWYNPGSPFCTALDEQLAKRGSPARCWAHTGPQPKLGFSWTGRNSWVDRSVAATELADLMIKLRSDGWRYHIVAHSHGGNVVLEALHLLTGNSIIGRRPESWKDGTIVLMGTPIITTFAPARTGRARRLTVYLASSLVAFGGVLWMTWNRFPSSTPSLMTDLIGHPYAPLIGVLVLIAAVFLTIFAAFRILAHLAPPQRHRLLILRSRYDEAWQLLSLVRTASDPIRTSGQPLSRWLAAIPRVIRAHSDILFPRRSKLYEILLTCSVALATLSLAFPQPNSGTSLLATLSLLAIGLPLLAFRPHTFLAVACWPARLVHWAWTATKSLAQYFGSFMVRRMAWRYLRAAALGAEDYPYATPDVHEAPKYLDPEFYTVQEIDPALIDRLRANAASEFSTHTNALVDLIADGRIAPVDVNAILSDLALNTSTVHSAYYTEDELRNVVADWISRTEHDIKHMEQERFHGVRR